MILYTGGRDNAVLFKQHKMQKSPATPRFDLITFQGAKFRKTRTSNVISNTFQNHNLIVNYNPKRL